MKRIRTFTGLLLLILAAVFLLVDRRPDLDEIAAREGPALREGLHRYAAWGHRPLGYRRAREVMYWQLDAKGGGIMTVYERRVMPIGRSEFPAGDYVNCEHLWPQSRGAGKEPAKSDLFHLRSSVSAVNAVRSNLPFGSAEADIRATGDSGWEHGYESDGDEVFEPPVVVRGDIARAMFYFAVRYEMAIDDDEEADLRAWHAADPVDEAERERALQIEAAQGNRNPFIERPELVGRITDF